jgi:hypothetical protein
MSDSDQSVLHRHILTVFLFVENNAFEPQGHKDETELGERGSILGFKVSLLQVPTDFSLECFHKLVFHCCSWSVFRV